MFDYDLKPQIIVGGYHVDDRGKMTFSNDFHFTGIKRFYTIENNKNGDIRAWHAHKEEQKFFMCIQGRVLVRAMPIYGSWENPDRSDFAQDHACALYYPSGSIFHIPGGYANGFQSFSDDAKVMVFSTASLEESKNDDYRFPPDYWGEWMFKAYMDTCIPQEEN